MSKKSPDEAFRELMRGIDMPSHDNLEEIVHHPWADGINFNQPPSEAEMKILTKAGFEYHEKLGMAWRKRDPEHDLFGKSPPGPGDRGRE